MVGISYGGGPFESAHFQRIVKPGSSLFFNGWFDPLYLYPADTQNYIVSKTVGQGAVTQPDSIISPSKDRVQIEYQIAVYFRLNIDRLRAFHESFGLQYAGVHLRAAGRSSSPTRSVSSSRTHCRRRPGSTTSPTSTAAPTSSPRSRTRSQQKLSDRLVASLGQPFFCGPTYEPGQDCSVADVQHQEDRHPARRRRRRSRTTARRRSQVLTSQNTIAQRQAEAQAIEALNAGLSQAGMPYVLLRAIESGNISFWVLPSDSGVTLQVPPGGGAPAAPDDRRAARRPPPAAEQFSLQWQLRPDGAVLPQPLFCAREGGADRWNT